MKISKQTLYWIIGAVAAAGIIGYIVYRMRKVSAAAKAAVAESTRQIDTIGAPISTGSTISVGSTPAAGSAVTTSSTATTSTPASTGGTISTGSTPATSGAADTGRSLVIAVNPDEIGIVGPKLFSEAMPVVMGSMDPLPYEAAAGPLMVGNLRKAGLSSLYSK